MHLMIFIEIAKPNWFERLHYSICSTSYFGISILFYTYFFQEQHIRLVGYFEEEAVISYTRIFEAS